MADVEVGQVRREPPRNGAYRWPPIRIVAIVDEQRVRVAHGDDSWVTYTEDISGWPLWPSEHEQYKDARGYEVKT